jgi:hypothetical protein
VAARHRTGEGRRRRSGQSGLQRPGGPASEMENENEKMELGWAARNVWAEIRSGH